MSFNDLSPLREAFARIPDTGLNSSERSLLWVIASYPKGCFVGEETLAKMAGLKLRTSKDNLRKLRSKKLIWTEQSFARKGLRQCYHANLAELEILADTYDTNKDSVRLTAPFNKPKQLNGSMSADKTRKGAEKRAKGSDTPHPYIEDKEDKYDKELFNEFISNLRTDIVSFITPGKNLDELLLKVKQQDTTFKRLYAFLETKNFNTSYKVGGLLINFLKEYLGLKKPGQKDSMPKWCERSGCNPVTRLWLEPSIDINGKEYYECNKCHPAGILRSRKPLNDVSIEETRLDNLLSHESESIDRVVKSMENEEKEFSKIYEELVRREGDIFKDLDF